MKKLFLAIIISLALTGPAFAYSIDGSVADWGINLSAASTIGYLNTHLPSGGNDIDYGTPEDNANASSPVNTYVGPGYTTGNAYDAEALYFDNDANYAYIALISGTKPNDTYTPGDILIDTDNNGSYDAAIRFSSTGNFSVVTGVTAWNNVSYSQHSIANYWTAKTWTTIYTTGFSSIYAANPNSHYVWESAVPLSYLGLSYGDNLTLHWTMKCGNDYLNTRADVNSTPEPASLSLLGIGLLGLAGLRKKNA